MQATSRTSAVNGTDRVVLAADIGGTKIDVAIASSTGKLLARKRIETRAERGPEQAFTRIAAAFDALREERSGGHVAGVAVVAPGVIQSDHILLAPNLPGWQNVALARSVSVATGFATVAVTNDVKAGALAELRFGGLRGVNPGLFLNLGTGLACALVINGHVVEGANNAAGEIGYLRPGGSTALAGPPRLAALEELIGGRAISQRTTDLLPAVAGGEHVLRHDDPVARHITHTALAELGAAVANLCTALNPQAVVVGGGMMAAAEVILPVLRAHLDHAVPFPPTLAAANFTADAPLYGAIALAIDAATSTSPSTAPVLNGARP